MCDNIHLLLPSLSRHSYFEYISTFDYCRGSVQGCKELLKWNVVLRHKKKERRLSSGGRWIDLTFLFGSCVA